MKKQSALFLVYVLSVGFLGQVSVIHPMEEVTVTEEYASPFISLGQIADLKNQFIAWTNKYYRCLIGGRCTRREKEEVKIGLATWGKRLGWATLIAILAATGRHYKVIPKVKQYAQKQRETLKEGLKGQMLELIDPLWGTGIEVSTKVGTGQITLKPSGRLQQQLEEKRKKGEGVKQKVLKEEPEIEPEEKKEIGLWDLFLGQGA